MAIEDLRPPSKDDRATMSKKNLEAVTERSSRYHRVFVQNKDGAKILEEWLNTFVFGGFTANDASVTELAKAEARREIVGMIIAQINLPKRSG